MTAVAEVDVSLTNYEGWDVFASLPRPEKPQCLSVDAMRALSKREAAEYRDSRAVWHSNLGPYITPQMASVATDLLDIVEGNRQHAYKAKTSAVLDAYPGLGKTTLALHVGKKFHRDQIETYGSVTDRGDLRIPVAYIPLAGLTTMRTLNIMLCDFYGLPTRGNSADLGRRAARAALRSQTRLIIVDDTHFLNIHTTAGRQVANHLKWLSAEFPVTFLFVGVDLLGSGLMTEGLQPGQNHRAQTARRWTRVSLTPFTLADNQARTAWLRLLKSIEKDLTLANLQQGTLERLAGYLFARSSGHFSSLMTIISRGCHRAIRDGSEDLTIKLLDGIKNDEAAETARKTLEADVVAGRLTTVIR